MIDIDKSELILSKKNLRSSGFHIYKNLLSQEICSKAMSDINCHINNNEVEENYSSSEFRIWESESKLELCSQFKKFSDNLYNEIFNSEVDSTILAIKNTAVIEDAQTKSRWHADSFSNQFKLFLFLSDVSIDNGPLEYVIGSKDVLYKFKNLNDYFNFKGFFKNTLRSYSEIQDNFLEDKIESFTLNQGSFLIVNTSAVHRAKPCIAGERYALTAYF